MTVRRIRAIVLMVTALSVTLFITHCSKSSSSKSFLGHAVSRKF